MTTRETDARRSAIARRKAARRKRKIAIFIVEIILIFVMLFVVFVVVKGTGGFGKGSDEGGFFAKLSQAFNPNSGPKITKIDEEEIMSALSEQVQMEVEEGSMKGYINIALFGVDANNDSQLYKNSRSDSTMIASINTSTGDIKLLSVYRDTYLNVGQVKGNVKYNKCNSAYSYGGPEQAIKMLNSNLDMNIEKFVTVGYRGLKEVIDGLGGVYLDINDVELQHINNYQIDIADKLNTTYVPVTQTGRQLLNGLQASAYCRIRYGGGDDFLRASRQREVILAIEEQAKNVSFDKLTKAYEGAIGDIYTNIDSKDILDLLKNITKYKVVAEDGMPQESMRTTGNIGAKGSCVVPLSLESNVEWMHKFFFDDDNYAVSDTVKNYGKQIASDTNPYIQRN
ncbi:MAG: LCP family protein [Lachnospiraceae bacterium]|nr:LCP family protein [Lachnospiraceae bacterium]